MGHEHRGRLSYGLWDWGYWCDDGLPIQAPLFSGCPPWLRQQRVFHIQRKIKDPQKPRQCLKVHPTVSRLKHSLIKVPKSLVGLIQFPFLLLTAPFVWIINNVFSFSLFLRQLLIDLWLYAKKENEYKAVT